MDLKCYKYKYKVWDIVRSHPEIFYAKEETFYASKRWGPKNIRKHLNRGYENNPVVQFTWVRDINKDF